MKYLKGKNGTTKETQETSNAENEGSDPLSSS